MLGHTWLLDMEWRNDQLDKFYAHVPEDSFEDHYKSPIIRSFESDKYWEFCYMDYSMIDK